ncbi:MAG TPA: transcription termination factor NusA [Syntrophales bacterium]|nr:transcription termination factor NusA [Syntrophales bacterium]HOM06311.1 transcription termination factor NusA [Syntrophales bacterium]HON99250.1 transcription termination factor NusA [Syntrophales bacterium]HPC00075.1 transcription termination factor NusA [Syntrophales bacterium]HPQ05708.1 transcription termination factor NusA [Syntrophales bacterium]
MFPELKRLIDQLGKDRGIDRAVIIEALEAAMLRAARQKLGPRVEIEAHYNDELGEIEVFQFKTVEVKVTDPEVQISLAEARELDEEAEPGDELGIKVDTSTFGRIAVQAAKQIIIQKVKDAERDTVYEEYKDRKGTLVSGFIQRFEGGNIVVNLGRAEGVIPAAEQIHREGYRRGERIRAFIFDVKDKTAKGPQILLSRTHPGFLKALFEMEVPEISEGLIEIVSVAREPGKRAKIAVRSKDRDIDPVGACVGMRGSRVQGVVQELRGEKIDVVPYSEDPAKYVCAALSPAKVDRVLIDEESRAMEVIVPDDQLSLAIGKNGLNVQLAVRLTGWKIDVKGESATKEEEDARAALMKIPGMTEEDAEILVKGGIKDPAQVAATQKEVLADITGAEEDRIEAWIAAAAVLTADENSKRVS